MLTLNSYMFISYQNIPHSVDYQIVVISLNYEYTHTGKDCCPLFLTVDFVIMITHFAWLIAACLKHRYCDTAYSMFTVEYASIEFPSSSTCPNIISFIVSVWCFSLMYFSDLSDNTSDIVQKRLSTVLIGTWALPLTYLLRPSRSISGGNQSILAMLVPTQMVTIQKKGLQVSCFPKPLSIVPAS